MELRGRGYQHLSGYIPAHMGSHNSTRFQVLQPKLSVQKTKFSPPRDSPKTHFTPPCTVIMCNYTQVEYRCGHVRYTVRAWCTNYETTHKRCPPSVVAIEFRYYVWLQEGRHRLTFQVGQALWRLPSASHKSDLAKDLRREAIES